MYSTALMRLLFDMTKITTISQSIHVISKGVVGVASAGSGCYVIALADIDVQHGALAGRLKSLGSHVREALSQLD